MECQLFHTRGPLVFTMESSVEGKGTYWSWNIVAFLLACTGGEKESIGVGILLHFLLSVPYATHSMSL